MHSSGACGFAEATLLALLAGEVASRCGCLRLFRCCCPWHGHSYRVCHTRLCGRRAAAVIFPSACQHVCAVSPQSATLGGTERRKTE